MEIVVIVSKSRPNFQATKNLPNFAFLSAFVFWFPCKLTIPLFTEKRAVDSGKPYPVNTK